MSRPKNSAFYYFKQIILSPNIPLAKRGVSACGMSVCAQIRRDYSFYNEILASKNAKNEPL